MGIEKHEQRSWLVPWWLFAFCLGLLCFFLFQKLWSLLAPCHTKYDLLNPSIPCSNTIQQGEWDYEPLRDTLTAKKVEWKNNKTISHLSIYFRDLDHGPRFGIGEYDKFQPASLTKVPVMIAILHEVDHNPELLNKKLSFTGTLNTNQNTEAPGETLEPNTPYTIRELLTKMIVYSDNYSYLLLTKELNTPSPLSAYYTFRDLEVLKMMLAPKADYVSIQSYANLFAILYNTGYLSKETSQFALTLLSQATFTDGIVSGVPPTIRVAHKFGNRDLEGGEIQLHDCGIIYHPSTHYLLCIMTSGTDIENERTVIAEISRMVYEEISTLALKNR